MTPFLCLYVSKIPPNLQKTPKIQKKRTKICIFQLPVIAYFLAKLGFITGDMLAHYRKYAFVIIMIVAAIITPPDLMTLVLVTIPLYVLYEVSIIIARHVRVSTDTE